MTRLRVMLKRLRTGVLSVLCVMFAFAPVQAADWNFTVTRVTPVPVLSGTEVIYELQLSCSAVAEPSCDNGSIVLDIPDDSLGILDLEVQLPNPIVQSVSGATIDIIDTFPAGAAASIFVHITPPNGITPNNYSWTLNAAVNADNTTEALDSEVGSSTASAQVSIFKAGPLGTADGLDVALGEPVRYYLIPCDPSVTGAGELWLDPFTVTDILPLEATFVTASPGFSFTDNTAPTKDEVTWGPISGFELLNCSASTSPFWVEVEYPGATTGLSVTNETNVVGTPIGESSSISASDTINHSFVMSTPDGSVAKTNFALGKGGDFNTSAFAGSQARWFITARNTGNVPVIYELVDPLPCLTNVTGSPPIYLSNDPGDICASPLFVVDEVSSSAITTAYNNGYRIEYTTNMGTPGIFERGSHFSTYIPMGVPTGEVIAEVRFPADPSLVLNLNQSHFHTIIGSIVADDPVGTMPAGAQVVNTINATFDAGSGTSVVGSDDSSFRILDSVSVGQIGKFISVSGTPNVRLTADNWSASAQIMTVTDLLPLGMEFSAVLAACAVPQGNCSTIDPDLIQTEVIPNYMGTGRTLVRAVSLEEIPVGWRFSFRFSVEIDAMAPGTYVNTGELFLGDQLGFCRVGVTSQPPVTGDPLDLDSDADLADTYCQSSTTFSIPLEPAFLVSQKKVKGDQDTEFQGFPSVGAIGPGAGGTAEYELTLTNEGTDPLTNIVLYDILPFVGDAGVSDSQLATARGSDFTVDLTSLLTVSGVGAPVVGYAQAFVDPGTSVANPGNALNAPNVNEATLGNGDVLVLDMGAGVQIGSGEGFILHLRGRATAQGPNQPGEGTGTVQICTDSSGTTCGPVINITEAQTGTTIAPVSYTANATGRYVRVARSSDEIRLDAVEYTSPGSIVVEYNDSTNPCRTEVASSVSCDTAGTGNNDWVTTPDVLGDVSAFRITIPTIAAGDTVTITFPVVVDAAYSPVAGDIAWNSFAVDATELLATEPPKVGLAVPQSDISVEKTVNGGESAVVTVGEEFTFEIVVRHDAVIVENMDGSVSYVDRVTGLPTGAVYPAENVILTDIIPSGLNIVSVFPGGYDFGANSWTVGDIYPGQEFTLTLTATLASVGSYINAAHVTSNGVVDVDSTPGNWTGTPVEDDEDTATVVAVSPAINLQKQVEDFAGSGNYIEADMTDGESGIYLVGQAISYKFVVSNPTGLVLTNVVVDDPLIAGFCDPATLQIPTLGPFASVDLFCTYPFGFSDLSAPTVNTASVTGEYNGTIVSDTDPAQIELTPSDLGDAPDSYSTVLAVGPRHGLFNYNSTSGTSDLHLGTTVDNEFDGQPSAVADGDGSDEDGVTFSVTADNDETKVQLVFAVGGVNNMGQSAMLCGYLDGAADGIVSGAFDRAVTYAAGQVGLSNPTVAAGNEELCIQVPTSGSTSVTLGGAANAASATCTGGVNFSCSLVFNPNYPAGAALTTYARFRLTTDPKFFSTNSPSPIGGALNGEVEDYTFDITPTRATVSRFETELVPASSLRGSEALSRLVSGIGDSELVNLVRWETVLEQGTSGFDLERRSDGGFWQKLNTEMLPGLVVSRQGGEYLWVDTEVGEGEYSYRLVEHEVWGTELVHGPWHVNLQRSSADEAGGRGKGRGKKASSISEGGTSNGVLEWWAWEQLGGRFAGRGRSAALPDEQAVAQRLQTRAAKRQNMLRSTVEVDAGSLDGDIGSSLGRGQQGFRKAKPGQARLVTDTAGWYRAEVVDVAAALGDPVGKLKASLRKGSMALEVAGEAIPYSYDGGDGVYFVGYPYQNLDTFFNAYQLSHGSGMLMEATHGTGPSSGVAGTFRDTFVAEQEVWLLPWANREEGSDPWYWDFTYAPYTPATVLTFDLPDAAGFGTANLRVALRGASNEGNGPDHHAWVSVNGQVLPGEVIWDAFGLVFLETSFDQSLLAGGNTVTLTVHAQTDHGAPYSLVLIDDVEVSFERKMKAQQGSVWVRDASDGVMTVEGFELSDIRVIELGDGTAAIERQNLTVGPDGLGGWQASFLAESGRDYLVVDRALSAGVEIDTASSLKNRGLNAEYLIIAPESLAEGAQALSDYRSDRFSTEIVWLQDIYDEFSYGRTDSAAIQAFLASVYSKSPQPPLYITLLGRGTLDHRDLQGYGESLIPLRLAVTPWGLYSSDNRYADINGDKRPEYSLGRIQAMTNAEVLTYVNKLAVYEAGVGSGVGLVIADNPDDAGDFHANSDETATSLTSYGMFTDKLYHPNDPVRVDLLAGWSAGDWSVIVYDGHGAATQLGSEGYIKSSDVAGLTNGSALPIFTAWTCAAGDSTSPGILSLADSLVLSSTGGAIVSVAPAGLSLDNPAHRLSQSFLDSLVGGTETVGQAFIDAHEHGEAEGLYPWMLDIYLVAGDPAVSVQD